jgi:hypothetical protein
MRPIGLSSGFYKDSIDYGVFSGEWCIGRIYENRSGPKELRWFWSLHAPGGRETQRASNQVARSKWLAKAEFESARAIWPLDQPQLLHLHAHPRLVSA